MRLRLSVAIVLFCAVFALIALNTDNPAVSGAEDENSLYYGSYSSTPLFACKETWPLSTARSDDREERELKPKEQIREQYNNLSGGYDAMLSAQSVWAKLAGKLVWGFPDALYVERLLSYLPSDFKGKLLDVPVGTGLFTCDKYKSLPNADIICLDYSEGMLNKARERFTAAGIMNVKLQQGDIGDLPFGDGEFDAILSMNGFHAFPDKQAAFGELHRVLKQGGRFVGCFYIAGEVKRTDRFIKHLYVPKGWFTPPFMTVGEIKRKLETDYNVTEFWTIGSIAGFCCGKGNPLFQSLI
jgi:SAM-dependent methyltransferase